jgi:hypothetical protein
VATTQESHLWIELMDVQLADLYCDGLSRDIGHSMERPIPNWQKKQLQIPTDQQSFLENPLKLELDWKGIIFDHHIDNLEPISFQCCNAQLSLVVQPVRMHHILDKK